MSCCTHRSVPRLLLSATFLMSALTSVRRAASFCFVAALCASTAEHCPRLTGTVSVPSIPRTRHLHVAFHTLVGVSPEQKPGRGVGGRSHGLRLCNYLGCRRAAPCGTSTACVSTCLRPSPPAGRQRTAGCCRALRRGMLLSAGTCLRVIHFIYLC